MQLLRDNLTLWTSSDGAEAAETGGGQAEQAPKETEKPTTSDVEAKTADSTAESKAAEATQES